MIEFTQAERPCVALTRQEADEREIDYIYWKDCPPRESGHILTDDDYVLELMYCREYPTNTGGTSRVIRAYGAFKWISANGTLNFMDYHNHGIYTKTNPAKSWMEAEANKSRTRRAIGVLVASFMATGKFDYHRAGKVYRPEDPIPEASIKRLLRSKHVQTMLEDRLRKAYDKLGFDEEFTIKAIKEAYEVASKNEDALNMLRVAEKGIELLGMTPGRITETRSEQINEGSKLLERAQKYQRQVPSNGSD